MKFKYPQLANEYNRLHPMLLGMCESLTKYCYEAKLPEPVATHILRTRKEQISIYWQIVMQAKKCDEATARKLAGERPTLHFFFAGIDLRDYIYTPAQIKDVQQYLRTQCVDSKGHYSWELLYHDVGRGNHFHIGIKDTNWNNTHKVLEE